MGVLDQLRTSARKFLQIENIDKRKPQSAGTMNKITERTLFRVKQDIEEWRQALRFAEQDTRPDRKELVRTYKDVILDTHVESVMEIRKSKCLNTDFWIEKPDGTRDDELTEALHEHWFFEVMDAALDSIFYGFEVIELGDIVDDKFSEVTKIREEYVIPERDFIKKELNVNDPKDGIFFKEAPERDWVLWIGKKMDWGLLNKLAPHAIWKKNVLGNWATRAEVLGMPIRIGKTNIYDEKRKENMVKFLSEMGANPFAVIDENDLIELIQANTGGHVLYKDLVDTVNDEMSKGVLGGVGTIDEKSFVGAAEVQERTLDDFSIRDKRRIKHFTETQVFRVMRRHGLMSMEPRKFKWNFEAKLTKEQELKIAETLHRMGAELDQNELQERFGFTIVELKERLQEGSLDESIIPAVENMYNEFKQHKH